MAVKAVGTWVAGFCEMGRSDLGGRRAVAGAAAGPNWRSEVSRVGGRLERAGVCMKPVKDVKPVKDENLSSAPPSSEVDGEAGNGGAGELLSKLNMDLQSGFLPSGLLVLAFTIFFS